MMADEQLAKLKARFAKCEDGEDCERVWPDEFDALLARLEAAEAVITAVQAYYRRDSWFEIPGSTVEIRKAKASNDALAAWRRAAGKGGTGK